VLYIVLVSFITWKPIHHTNECAEVPQTPRASTHGEKMNEVVKEEYFLSLVDSAESASLLAPLEEVDRLDAG